MEPTWNVVWPDGKIAPQLVDMSHLPRVTKGSRYSDGLLYYFLFHNSVQLIIYTVFKYQKKICSLGIVLMPPHGFTQGRVLSQGLLRGQARGSGQHVGSQF